MINSNRSKKFFFICLSIIIFLVGAFILSWIVIQIGLRHKGFLYFAWFISLLCTVMAYESFSKKYFPEDPSKKTENHQDLNPDLLDDGLIESHKEDS
jgi:hypothetical protein